MRMGVIRNSELIAAIGTDAEPGRSGNMRVKYQDGTVFEYRSVPYSTFRKIATSRHPGQDWLKVRDQFKFKEVSH